MENSLIQMLIGLIVLCVHADDVRSQVNQACGVALPYEAADFVDCSPQRAAAYDFAFCHVHYQVAALSRPPTEAARALAESYTKKALIYGRIATALSDQATFTRNVELTKKFYESLNGQNSTLIGQKLAYVRDKCNSIEGHHAQILEEAVGKLKSKEAGS